MIRTKVIVVVCLVALLATLYVWQQATECVGSDFRIEPTSTTGCAE